MSRRSRVHRTGKPGATIEVRKADDNEPFCALAFKLMLRPAFVGHLTYVRVYSGRDQERGPGLQRQPAQEEGAHRAAAPDARQQA